MEIVFTPDAPKPAGHYSQGVIQGGLVYVSGQLGVDPADPRKKPGDIEAQTEQALKNIAAILEAAGSDPSRIVKMTIYISDISTWGKVNEVCARFFGGHKPARAVIPCGELHFGYLIEAEAVAAL